MVWNQLGNITQVQWKQIDPVANINDFNFQLGRTQAGVSDIFMVTFTPINAGAIVYCDLSWFEII